MSDTRTSASALRQAFDLGFASARASAEGTATEAFMAFRAHGQPLALAVADVAGLYLDRKIVPVPQGPGATRGLLGLSALRSVMTPVYDLGLLLGVSPRPAEREGASPWRWMVVVREVPDSATSPSIGFAFAAFEAHLRARREDLLAAPASALAAAAFVSSALPVDGIARPLVNVKALFVSVKGPSRR